MADTPRHHTLPSFLAFVLSVASDLVEKALALPAVDVQAVDAVAGSSEADSRLPDSPSSGCLLCTVVTVDMFSAEGKAGSRL